MLTQSVIADSGLSPHRLKLEVTENVVIHDVERTFVALERLRFGAPNDSHRQLKITIPENLNYESLFDDLFAQYTRSHELTRVRTTNMGTLYELVYAIELKDPEKTRDFIDAIRCRNGNLNIICGREAERDVM